MAAYNSVNGIPASQSHELLAETLKRDWEFRGFIISDQSAVGGAVVLHHTEPNTASAGKRSLEAVLSALSRRFGNDFTVTGQTSAHAALGALEAMAAGHELVALLLVDDLSADFLDRAHVLYPSAKRVLGFSPEEVVGQNAFRYIYREDLPKIKRDFEHLIHKPGNTVDGSYRIKHADGSFRYVEGHGSNLLHDSAF